MLPIQKKITEESSWLSNLNISKKVTTYGEVFTIHKTNTGGFDSPTQKSNRIKALLAGQAAEKVLLGASSYSYRAEDLEQARALAEGFVFKGLKKDHFSREAADKMLNEVMDLLRRYEDEITKFLEENKEKLTTVADALNKHLTLTAQDVKVMAKL